MKKVMKSLIVIALCSFVVVGCVKKNSDTEKGQTRDNVIKTIGIKDRVSFLDTSEILFQNKDSEHRLSNARVTTTIPLTGIVKYAHIAPPEIGDNESVAVAKLDFDGNYTYVSYVTPGNVYGGGVDLFLNTIQDCYQDVDCFSAHTRSFVSDKIDVSATKAFDKNKLAIVGAVKPYSIHNGDKRSAIFTIGSTEDPSPSVKYKALSSTATLDVETKDGKLYVVTGKNGGQLEVLNENLEVLATATVDQPDLRSVELSDTHLFLLNGNGEVYKAPLSNPTDLTRLGQAGEPSDIRANSIANMTYDDGYLYIPLNDGGFTVLNAENGTTLGTIDKMYCTSVTVGKYYFYVGGSRDGHGVIDVYYLLKDKKTGESTIHKTGTINLLNEAYQVNDVQYAVMGENEWGYPYEFLLVANGKAGTIVLEILRTA